MSLPQHLVKRCILIVCVVYHCTAFMPFHTAAADTAAASSWLTQSEMTGTWGGLRPQLAEQGITATGAYTTDLLGNPIGGLQQRFRYAGDLSVYVDADLETLAALQGLRVRLSASWRSGKDLAADLGSTFSPAQIFGGDTVRLFELYIEQSLFDDRLSLQVGRIGAGDDFLASPLYGSLVSAAFNGNPASVPINLPGFTVNPVATWGTRLKVQPLAAVYIMTGVYNSQPTVGENNAHGVDFSFGDGVLVHTEMGYLHNQGEGATGLPGNYKIGAYYDSSPFADLSGPPDATLRGNYGFYVLLDQMVYREGGPDSLQGLTPFVALTFAPQHRRNPMPFFSMGGLVYQGLVPGRDDDVTTFGVAYGKFSNRLEDQGFELVLEWSHAFALTPWLTVQPDVQYVIHPSGDSDIPNALVLGTQLTLKF